VKFLLLLALTTNINRLCPYDRHSSPVIESFIPKCKIDSGNFSTTKIANQISVVTWNIARGVKYGKILETLQTIDADILLLNEVDRFNKRSGNRNIAHDLAKSLGMNYVYAVEFIEISSFLSKTEGEHGQAILSKFPLKHAKVIRHDVYFDWSTHPLQTRWGNRITLVANTFINGKKLRLYSTHYESQSNERQRDEITRSVISTKADDQIFAGDLNTKVGSDEESIKYLISKGFKNPFTKNDLENCTSSSKKCKRIDWIFYRSKSLIPIRTQVGDFDGSDHKWIKADFIWSN